MSYKSNPIINRVKQTIGWQTTVHSALPLKKLNTQNIYGVKLVYFLKGWFKIHNWILLNIQRVISNKTQIWYVSAYRVPKKRKERRKIIPNFSEIHGSADVAKNSIFYKKSLRAVFKHYKNRKKTLFSFTKTYRFFKKKRTFFSLMKNRTESSKLWIKFLFGFHKNNALSKKMFFLEK